MNSKKTFQNLFFFLFLLQRLLGAQFTDDSLK